MPELPELEAMKDELSVSLVGQRITAVAVRQPYIVKTFPPPIESIVGDSFAAVQRRGKYLLFGLSSGWWLVTHLMRSGRLVRTPSDKPVAKPTALVLSLADGTDLRLAELGTKKRARVHLVSDPQTVVGHLGVEPLSADLTPERLAELLAADRRQIKPFLEDQRLIAGIGNAYSDEILVRARLSPFKPTTGLSSDETQVLHQAVVGVLSQALEHARQQNYLTSLGRERRSFLAVHGRAKQPCPVCGTPIAEIRYAQRSTYYCPTCQTGGRLLADRRFSVFLK